MRRILLLLFLCLIVGVPTFAQSTSVSGTITDSGSQAWAYGSYSFSFKPASNNPQGPYFWNGSAFNVAQVISGSLDSSGAFSGASVPSNTSITPSGSTWIVQVCPGATTACYQKELTITGASQDITASVVPPPVVLNLGNPPPGAAAYTDAEVIGAKPGSFYYNITSNTLHVCSITSFPPCTWQSLSSTGNANTWTQPQTFNAAMNANAGGVLNGTFTGNATFTGNNTHSGTEKFTGISTNCKGNGEAYVDVSNLCGWSGATGGEWIASAVSYLATSGGIVQIGPGTYSVNSTITISTKITIIGAGQGGPSTAGPSPSPVTTLNCGTISGPCIQYTAVSGAGNAQLKGVSLQKLSIQCNGTSAIGLGIYSVRYSRFSDLYIQDCTDANIDLNVVASLADTRDTQYNVFDTVSSNTGVPVSTANADSFRASGDATANTSLNVFRNMFLSHCNGHGLHLLNTDDNLYENIASSQNGGCTGNDFYLHGSGVIGTSPREETFVHIVPTAGGFVQDNGSTGNAVWGYSLDSGPAPVYTGTLAFYTLAASATSSTAVMAAPAFVTYGFNQLAETSSPTPLAAYDMLWGDSSSHRLKMNNNNGTSTNVAGASDFTLTLKKGSGAGNYTNATTSYTVADATNLCYTVTIPTGWKLGISASGYLSTATAAVPAQAALTDNAACSTANAGILVETAPIQGAGIGLADGFALNWVITGDGAAHNVALQFKTSNAADAASLINSSATVTPTIKFELMPSN